jgi:hypothetical protein
LNEEGDVGRIHPIGRNARLGALVPALLFPLLACKPTPTHSPYDSNAAPYGVQPSSPQQQGFACTSPQRNMVANDAMLKCCTQGNFGTPQFPCQQAASACWPQQMWDTLLQLKPDCSGNATANQGNTVVPQVANGVTQPDSSLGSNTSVGQNPSTAYPTGTNTAPRTPSENAGLSCGTGWISILSSNHIGHGDPDCFDAPKGQEVARLRKGVSYCVEPASVTTVGHFFGAYKMIKVRHSGSSSCWTECKYVDATDRSRACGP